MYLPSFFNAYISCLRLRGRQLNIFLWHIFYLSHNRGVLILWYYWKTWKTVLWWVAIRWLSNGRGSEFFVSQSDVLKLSGISSVLSALSNQFFFFSSHWLFVIERFLQIRSLNDPEVFSYLPTRVPTSISNFNWYSCPCTLQ